MPTPEQPGACRSAEDVGLIILQGPSGNLIRPGSLVGPERHPEQVPVEGGAASLPHLDGSGSCSLRVHVSTWPHKQALWTQSEALTVPYEPASAKAL